MNHLWSLVQGYIDKHGTSEAQVARRIGVIPQTLSGWKRGLKRLPEKESLQRCADLISTSYDVVLEAALRDSGYLLPHSIFGDDDLARLAELTSEQHDLVASVVDAFARANREEPFTVRTTHRTRAVMPLSAFGSRLNAVPDPPADLAARAGEVEDVDPALRDQ